MIATDAPHCVYNSLTYIDQVEPQESVWVEEKKVVGLAVHNFYSAPVRVNAEDGRIHGQLEHVRDILEQAVLRRVHQLVPDGETELDERDIARGYAQFSAAMY